MPRWFWKVLWISQAVNWVVTIWAYGTPDGSCLMAPAFTMAWVLKDEIADCFRDIFTDDYTFEDEWEEAEKYYKYCQLKKGA